MEELEFVEFNSIDEIKEYYIKELKIYDFKKGGKYLNVKFNFIFNSELDSIVADSIVVNNVRNDMLVARDITCLILKAGTVRATGDVLGWYIIAKYLSAKRIVSNDLVQADVIIADSINAVNVSANGVQCPDFKYKYYDKR